MNNISDNIGLIELCFSGIHQQKEFQTINTKSLNDLIFTIKEQKILIKDLQNEIKILKAQVNLMNGFDIP